MSLETLIRDQLISNETMAGKLSTYLELPAIFFGIAPDDTDQGWAKNQYPRIVYTILKQSDNKRTTVGQLTIRLLCDSAGVLPEEIVPLLKETMRYLVLTPSDGTSAYCFAWNRTDAYEIPKTAGKKNEGERVLMDDVVFDIYEYSDQHTTQPDPVDALNLFLKKMVPQARVYGVDTFPERMVATNEEPVLYCRLNAVECQQQTFAIAMMNAMISVHILCPDPSVRIKYASSIMTELQMVNRIWMSDVSPMLIDKVAANFGSDPLVTGQVATICMFTIPRRIEHRNPLININRT